MIFYTCTPIDCYLSSSKEGKCTFTVYFVKHVLNLELLTVISYNSIEGFPSFSNHPLSLSVRWPINVNDIFKEYLHIQSITKKSYLQHKNSCSWCLVFHNFWINKNMYWSFQFDTQEQIIRLLNTNTTTLTMLIQNISSFIVGIMSFTIYNPLSPQR